MAVKVGIAYLQVQPEITPSQFASQLTAKLNDTMTRAGRSAGEAAGKQLGEGMAAEAPKKAGVISAKVNEQVVPKARKTGEQAGKQLGEGMAEHARSGLSKLTSIIGLSLGGLGVGEIVKSSLEAATAANKAQRLTEAVVKSTGEAAHVSADHVQELSEKLAGMTGIQATQISHAQNLLLTFTSIKNTAGAGNDVFDQATKSALNMSVALGEDSATAAMQLGKALNDPVKGITALRRAGVQLTDQQTEQVKAFVKSGDTVSAQKVILGELNKEFGGAAVAGSTSMGRLSAVIEVLKEKLGNLLLPVVGSLVTMLVKHGVPAIEALINGFKGVGAEGEGPAKTFNQIGQFVRQLVLDAKALLPHLVSIFKALWPFRSVIIGVVAAFIAWHKAVSAVQSVQKAMKAAQTLFKVGEGALGAGWIGLIIVGVVLLVAALIYAYKHFKGFRDFVNAVWRDIKIGVDWLWHKALEPAFNWIAKVGFPAVEKAATWLWRNVLKPVLLDFIVPAFKLLWAGIKLYVGFIVAVLKVEFAVVMWVWNHILKPVIFGFIIPAFKLLWAGIKLYIGLIVAAVKIELLVFRWIWTHVISPVIGFIVAGFKLWWAGVKLYIGFIVAVIRTVAAVAMWLWHNILMPVFEGIAAVLKVVWNFIIWPIFKLLLLAFKLIAEGGMWLWHNAIEPAIAGIGAVFAWLWKHAVKPIVDFIVDAFHGFEKVLAWLWHNVFEPAFRGIGAVASWLWDNAIKPVIGFIVDAFHGFEVVLNWLWHNVFEPVFQGIGAVMSWLWDKAIKPVIDTIKGAFSDAVDWIGKVWGGLGDVLMVPVKFIVNTIYNDGIRRAWNFLAHAAGFDELPAFTIGEAQAPATGGSKWGSIPTTGGGARHGGQQYASGGIVGGTGSGDIVPAMLTPGERVLSLTQVARLGGHAVIDMLVGRGGTGGSGLYADGGIISKVPGFGALLDLVNRIPGASKVRSLFSSLVGNGLTHAAQWIVAHVPGLDSLVKAAGAIAGGARKMWDKLFDAGGWLTPGTHVVANLTGRPEGVLRPAAVDQLGGPAVVNALNAGQRRPAFGDVHVIINNPVPEPASESVPAAMRRLAYQLAG